MFNPAWNTAERALASQRIQLAVFTALLVSFTLVRWRERLEPWNSDDLDLFRVSVDAAS